MKPKPAGHRVILLPAAVLFLFLGISMSNPGGIVTPLHDHVFNIFQTLHPRTDEKANGVRLVHVDIDSESLNRLGVWPWPRARVAELVSKISSAKPRTLAVAVLFPGPDPFAPHAVLTQGTPALASGPAATEQSASSAFPATPPPEATAGDTALALALRSANALGGFIFIEGSGGPRLPSPIRLDAQDVHPEYFLPAFGSVKTSYALIADAFRSSGHLNLIPETDEPARAHYIPLLARFGDGFYPSLSLEILRTINNVPAVGVSSRKKAANKYAVLRKDGLMSVSVGNYTIPTERDGALRLYYREKTPAPLAAWQIMEGQYEAHTLTDAIVILGASALPGGYALTPAGNPVPAASLQSQAIEQILTSAYLQRPDWALTAESLFVIIAGIMLILMTVHLGVLAGALFLTASVAGGVYASYHLFTENLLLVDGPLSSVVIGLIFIVTAIEVMIDRREKRRFLLSVMNAHLPETVASAFAARAPAGALEGQKRVISAMSCGLRGFERVEERFRDDPKGLSEFMHNYLSLLTEVIYERGGTLDKYVGHNITAFWNAPEDDDQHAFHACETAQRIVVKMEALNTMLENAENRHEKPFFRPLSISIGLNSGPATVGDLGSRHRLTYTAMGEPVRTACYLQHVSKFYGPAIVAGEGICERMERHFAFLQIDHLAETEASGAYRVYALLGDSITRASPRFKALSEAHERIFAAMESRDWAGTRNEIASARTLSGAIPTLYDLYEMRVAHYEQTPPDEGWNGAHLLNLS